MIVNFLSSFIILVNREDLDSLVEISLWPGQQDPMQVIDSKVCYKF